MSRRSVSCAGAGMAVRKGIAELLAQNWHLLHVPFLLRKRLARKRRTRLSPMQKDGHWP